MPPASSNAISRDPCDVPPVEHSAPITFRALDILRIALMQGELDNLRNDLGRALVRNDVEPNAFDNLLDGILALGVALPKTQDVVATLAMERPKLVGLGDDGSC